MRISMLMPGRSGLTKQAVTRRDAGKQKCHKSVDSVDNFLCSAVQKGDDVPNGSEFSARSFL